MVIILKTMSGGKNILHILMFKKKNDDFLWNNKNIE